MAFALAAVVPHAGANAQLGLPCVDLLGIPITVSDCADESSESSAPASDSSGGLLSDIVDVCIDALGLPITVSECADSGENGGGGGGGGGGSGGLGDLVDLCANVAGVQLNIGECGPGGGLVDVCANIGGIQVNVGECNGAGGGNDVCPTVPGVQTDPAQCPIVRLDFCPNIAGIQNPGNCGGGGNNAGGAAAFPQRGVSAACFFSEPNYAGQMFCLDVGQSAASSPIRVVSIELRPGIAVMICLPGTIECDFLLASVPQLSGAWLNGLGMIQVAQMQ
ncbi:MAG: hypothetical protein AB7U48_13375 [Bauldia sp.]